VTHCNAVYRLYRELLKDCASVRVLPVNVDEGEMAVWTEVVCDCRTELIQFLTERGVQIRQFIPCIHTAPHFRSEHRFPNSERFWHAGLNLPCGPSQPVENVRKTAALVQEFCTAIAGSRTG
jgi:dTDP-4-amino-4,6-dideoxygalactose transaminase